MKEVAQTPGPIEGQVAILVARFNPQVTDGLLSGALKTLHEHGVKEDQIVVVRAPGAFELPVLARHFADRKECTAVIALGAVIKGETAHFEYISEQCALGLGQVALETGVPVAFGVLTCYNPAQALARSADDNNNKGREAALAALETARILSSQTSDEC